MTEPKVLSVAVCLFTDAQLLDYGGPLDLLGFLNADDTRRKRTPLHLLRFTYIGPTEVVQPTAGPRVLMDATYVQLVNDSSKQFDVLFIPGGWGTAPRVVPPELLAFLKKQAPGAEHILSVCTGSWLLAQAGLLDGKRTTTNKALIDVRVAHRLEHPVGPPRAVGCRRQVLDSLGRHGRYATLSFSSKQTLTRVSIGLDMAFGWVGYLVGQEVAAQLALAIEHAHRAQDDDDFAGVWTPVRQQALAEKVKDHL